MCRSLLLLLLVPTRADNYHPSRLGRPHGTKPAPDERDSQFWYNEAFAAIEERLHAPTYDPVARNVLLFLGDGMSLPTQAAARALHGQLRGRSGEETRLAYERFPVTGLVKTYSVDQQVADSAATSTAYLCGVKANVGTLGVTARVALADCAAAADRSTHLRSIAAWAVADGRSAGIVTSARVTHASPAGAYAHSADRDWESDSDVRAAGADPALCPDIAHQLINSRPGNQFQVILGGGRGEFLANTTTDEEGARGRRSDGRDLVAEWRAQREDAGHSHAYAWNRTQLQDAISNPPDYLLGLFESEHMQYEVEAREAGNNEPTLAEMTEAAIRVLSKNPRGFFLFVEGARIDHAHHDNQPRLALHEVLALNDAVERADSLLAPAHSLFVVTADHAHAMTFNGDSQRGNDILGVSDGRGKDGVPYMTLTYANGPGYRDHIENKRPDSTTDDNFKSIAWRAPSAVPLDSAAHSGEDVAVFARWPQQALFTGLYEQSQLPHLMAHAACLGPAAERRYICDDSAAILSNPYLAVGYSCKNKPQIRTNSAKQAY